MRVSARDAGPFARAEGFSERVVEKVLQLMHLLSALNSHPRLRGKWALKGGTALNLFVLRYPRLSVDIDLNYIGALDREDMLEDRPRVERAAQAVFSREGFTVRRAPDEHAGGKWRLGYVSYTGQPAILEVDLNYMYRQPLWDGYEADSHPIGDHCARGIPLVDLHELAAGKLAALLSRRQSRDLFDCSQILGLDDLRSDQLRLAFVVYGAMNRKDWRTVSVEDIDFEARELTRQLRPMLRAPGPSGQAVTTDYARGLVEDCKRALSAVLPLRRRMSLRVPRTRLLDRGRSRCGIAHLRHIVAGAHMQPTAPAVEGSQRSTSQGTAAASPPQEHTSTPVDSCRPDSRLRLFPASDHPGATSGFIHATS